MFFIRTKFIRMPTLRLLKKLRTIFDFKSLLFLENLVVVETQNDRDWANVVETKTLTRLSLYSGDVCEICQKVFNN